MDFNTVLERSFEKPVLVDFWAPWCGPCRVLGPTLDHLANEQSDRWELVKVNTEEEQELAQDYRIMSIPNVKLFYRGEVVGEFAGALSKTQIEAWLEEHLPDARKDELDHLLDQLQNGENIEALDRLEALAKANPDLTMASVALAQHLVFTRPQEANDLVAPIHLGDKFYEEAEDIRQLARFMKHPAEGTEDAAQSIQLAQRSVQNEDWESAIKAIIAATQSDKTYADDLPRTSAVAFFRFWGPDNPLTRKYRRLFDMMLY